jgi:hypothetical protein
MWAEGATMGEIAQATGETRSAIAGAIDRARKAGDVRFVSRPTPIKPSPVKPKPAPIVASVSVRPVPFVELRPGQCRWPVNSPERGGVFLCCSAPVEKSRANYCARHGAIARRGG